MRRADPGRERKAVLTDANSNIPKFRSIADERLSRVMKRAVNRQPVPERLEAAVRSILRETIAES